MRSLFLGLAMLISVASVAQVASPTRKGVVQIGKGLNVNTTSGLLSLSATQTALPQGTLYDFGTMKVLIGTTTINANSKATISLTVDNTLTGSALFTKVLFATSDALLTGASASDVVIATPEAIPTDQKTVTFRYATGNSQNIVLGGTAVGLKNAAVATPIQFLIAGY